MCPGRAWGKKRCGVDLEVTDKVISIFASSMVTSLVSTKPSVMAAKAIPLAGPGG